MDRSDARRGSRRGIRRRPAIRTRVYRVGDSREGARHAARTAAGGDAVERRHLRHRARRTRRCCCGCARIRWSKCARPPTRCCAELRKVIPAFLTRVDQPDRGGRWSAYLADTRERTDRAGRAARSAATRATPAADEVTLTDFDPDGEMKVVAAALYAVVGPLRRGAAGRRASDDAGRARRGAARPASANATNRRHKPGRAFERTSYRFDILTDYGAFRDLQRHRLLTIDWQALSPRHGYTQPEAIVEAGGDADWREVMDRSAELYDALVGGRARGRRAVRGVDGLSRPLRHGHERARGHARDRAAHGAAGPSGLSPRLPADAPLIAERAGHRAIAAAMQFADHSAVELERLQEERRLEERRRK